MHAMYKGKQGFFETTVSIFLSNSIYCQISNSALKTKPIAIILIRVAMCCNVGAYVGNYVGAYVGTYVGTYAGAYVHPYKQLSTYTNWVFVPT